MQAYSWMSLSSKNVSAQISSKSSDWNWAEFRDGSFLSNCYWLLNPLPSLIGPVWHSELIERKGRESKFWVRDAQRCPQFRLLGMALAATTFWLQTCPASFHPASFQPLPPITRFTRPGAHPHSYQNPLNSTQKLPPYQLSESPSQEERLPAFTPLHYA